MKATHRRGHRLRRSRRGRRGAGDREPASAASRPAAARARVPRDEPIAAPRHPQRRAAAAAIRATPGTVGIYACGPTVYSRIHIGNARPFVVFSLLEALPRARGLRRHLVVNITDVNDKIYDAAARAGACRAPSWRSEMTERLHRRHRRARARASRSRAAGVGDDRPRSSTTSQTLIERGHAYAADGDVYFRVRSDDGYGSLSHRQARGDGPGRGMEGVERKRGSARLRPVEGPQGGRGHLVGVALGRGPARAGTSSARRWPSSCSASASTSTAAARTCVFPHHENEAAQTRAARGEELAQALDAQRDDPDRPARRWPSRSATSRPCTRCSPSTGARRWSCT